MMLQPVKKLSQDSNYERPEVTITESIQNKKNIEDQLKDFEEISEDDLNFININTQLKYISYDKKNKKELFRFGGLLVKTAKDYLILRGKENLSFSVQRYTKNENNEVIHNTRFFKRIKETDKLKIELEDTILKATEKLQKQSSIIEKQKKELIALKKNRTG